MVHVEDLEVLKSALSENANTAVVGDESFAVAAARWSDRYAPKPGAVVTVGSEQDVVETVKWATARHIPLMAQSGGHAWGNWWLGMGESGNGVVINMRRLNSVQIDTNRGEAVVGGGCIVKEVLVAAKQAGVHVMIGTCNSVGAIPSITGGGVGQLMGLYGCGADNMISARVVTADGELRTVSTKSHPDLWWALRGAASSFGIVTSLTVAAHREINGGKHYTALLAFPDPSAATLTRVVETATSSSRLQLGDDAALNVLFFRTPTGAPAVGVSLWHAGDAESARARFAPLFECTPAAPPVVVAEGETHYDQLNDGLDIFCGKGGFKPGWALSPREIDAAACVEVWERWVAFSARPGAHLSIVNLERYSTGRAAVADAVEATAVGPGLREGVFHVFFDAVYDDPALHGVAEELGNEFRSLMGRDAAGKKWPVYANFASGDEDVEQLWGSGERLDKLRALKRQWDPNGVFNQSIRI